MQQLQSHAGLMSRRRLLATASAGTLLTHTALVQAASAAPTNGTMNLGLPGGTSERSLTNDFPEKGTMVLQRTRPPLLETPFEVFDRGIFTPNDQFFVRWHWSVIPETVDLADFRLSIRGHVNTPLSLSMADLLRMPRVEMAAVNQCSGNSRGFFEPRIAGGEWANGAMGNAKWTGLRLRDLLDRAGVKAGAVQVRFKGLEKPVVPDAPDFIKSLDIDHARGGEVMLAYQMNDAQLPLLNGFPVRLVVPGWFSTYWIKMLSDIEVLDKPDDNYWMKTAYRIPDTPGANVRPGETGFKTVPINSMVPRSFVTNLVDGQGIRPSAPVPLRGIAFGGDCGVRGVDVSADGGASWLPATLGPDAGQYSFRQWTAQVTAPAGTPPAGTPPAGTLDVMVRCTNAKGLVQPMQPNWNGGGYMRNVVERTSLKIA